jgi:signal transduction histidine kinase
MWRVTEFRDITERQQVAEKIKEQNARLQAIAEDLKYKNEQLDEFTQIVSHNLRSPAGNIVSLSDFLATEQGKEEQVKILELLKQSGHNILTTLSELNEVLKIKQSENIEKRLLEFETVFVRTCQMLNAHIGNMGARVERNFDEAPVIEYPHIYLESIFLNLLSNALKYSSSQRVPSIKFKTYKLNDRIVLEVSDNGLGINLERYGHQIFKMRKTFHNHPDSRGIGLFMIKNQVEAMGGQIAVTSEVDVGTTFRVIF